MLVKGIVNKIIVHKPAKLNYELLRCSLGCPPDEIEVHEGDEQDKHQLIISLRFRMCQKRLRIMKMVVAELLLRVCSRSFSTIHYVQSPQDVYGGFPICLEIVGK
jgi:hypothetical protein